MGTAVLARTGGAIAAAAMAVALLFAVPAASADVQFCPIGEGAGQCGAPLGLSAQRGLAVDSEDDLLYVADESNNRIDVFEVDEAGEAMKFLFAFGYGVADGTTAAPQICTTTCFKGIAGEGAGQLDRPTAVAVDNDPASSSQHAVYVTDSQNLRVQRFEPTGEFVWAAGKGVDKTDGGDLCAKAESHVCGAGTESSAEGGFFSPPLVGTGPGVVYAVDNIGGLPGNVVRQRLQRFEPTGAPIPPQTTLHEETSAPARAIAVDAAGNLWVAGQEDGLRKYCSPSWASCAGPFLAGTGFSRAGLAIEAGGGLLLGQVENRDKGIGFFFNVIAALDPATGNVTRRFAYSEFADSINGLAAHSSSLGTLFASEPEEGIAYLSPPPPGPVTAAPSLEAKELGSAKATLVAEVNPEGKASEVEFEYVEEAVYLEDIAESGAGHGFDHAVSIGPQPLGTSGFELKIAEALAGCPSPASEAGEAGSKCLSPQTAYRWRVVATNADGGGNNPLEGPPFTTKPAPEFVEIWATGVGTDTARLHGEVNPTGIPTTGWFEYVDDATFQSSGFAEAVKAPAGAPLDFGSGDVPQARSTAIYPLEPGTLYRYRLVADSPLLSEPVAGEAELLRTFSPPQGPPCSNDASRIGPGAFLPDCRAYEMVSPIDKEGGEIRVLDTSVAEPAVHEQSAVSGEKLAYGSIRSFGGAVSAPFTSQYIARRVAGEEWETHPIDPPRGAPTVETLAEFDTEFKAFSADLCETWFTSFAEPPLAPGALAGSSNLYRRKDELCDEGKGPRYETLAPSNAVLQDVSADGSHTAFTTTIELLPEGTGGQAQLYEQVRGVGLRFVCVLPEAEGGGPVGGTCTAGSAAAGDPLAQTGRVSADGERIFWSTPAFGEGKLYVRIGGAQTVAVSKQGEEESGTAKSVFWGAAADGSTAIFSTTDTEAGVSDLYEFDVDTKETHRIAEGVIGVLGVGEDAGRVYFASRKALSGEEANGNGDKAQAGKANLYLRESDGSTEFIGTLAEADLGQALLPEPFRKHTALITPSGADATFVSVAPLTGYDNKDAESEVPREQVYRYDAQANELSCVSCNPSRARPAGRAQIPFWQTPAYAARVLSKNGSRLYFESADALAARDTNGKVDVYQWEEAGAGGCDGADGSFSPDSGGCVDLISSGQSPQGSRFVEASPAADDVFIATVSSLLPQDPGVVDVYDARVGGGLPIPPPPPGECEGDSCHPQIGPPEEPTPASAGYAAPPEAPAAKSPRRRCAKGKRRVSKKGASRCVAKKKQRRAKR